MRGGVKEKSPLVAVSSPFDVRLDAKYISALLAAVSRGQERSLKNFGSNSLRACPEEINREWQSAASGAGGGTGTHGERDLPPPHPEPLSRRPGGSGTTSPSPASGSSAPTARLCPARGGWGGFFFPVGRVCPPPPPPPFPFPPGFWEPTPRHGTLRPFTNIHIHISSPRAEVSSSKAQSKNNLQDLVCCYWYLSLSVF